MQVYISGDSIIAKGKVTDDKKLYKGKVQIKNEDNGFVIPESFYEIHFLTTINFHLAYKVEVTVHANYSAYIEVGDHGGNTVDTTVQVKVNP